MCLVNYAGFLRFSELANLRRSDITISDSHVSLFIAKSKTDHYTGKELMFLFLGHTSLHAQSVC